MKQIFYSNGKLLLTAEYVVLDGAKALALPTKFGQNLSVENGYNKEIIWKSYDENGDIWFEDTLLFESIIHFVTSEKQSERNTLLAILHEGFLLNPAFLLQSDGYFVNTNLTFPRLWGLGTSSTLINNIAQWLELDAFQLLQASFGGSGYDIACAQNATPILYELNQGNPIVEKVKFSPKCKEHLFFVYLNKKQNSAAAIIAYHKKQKQILSIIPIINRITLSLLEQNDMETLQSQLELHESTLAQLLNQKTVKEALFSDFKGAIKSLGAWGGDFVLVVSKENPKVYFEKKGYKTIIPYSEMILAEE